MTPEQLDEARAKKVLRECEDSNAYFTFIEVATRAARLARENWTPPEPVDPDLMAFMEWRGTVRWTGDPWMAFLAGARMARKQERERAKVLVSELENLADAEQADQDVIRDIALDAIAKYQEGGR